MRIHFNPQRFLLPLAAALFLLFLTAQEGEGCSTEEGAPESPEATSDATIEAIHELAAGEAEYIDWIDEQSVRMSESMDRTSGLFGDPQLLNDDWVIAVAAELALWKTSYQEASEKRAPDSFRDVHSKWVEALSRFDAAADLIASGIDNVDADTLDRGVGKMEEGVGLVEETTALINDPPSP